MDNDTQKFYANFNNKSANTKETSHTMQDSLAKKRLNMSFSLSSKREDLLKISWI